MGFPDGSDSKESACNAGDLGLIPTLGREDPLDKRMAPHASILAWRISWTEKPGRLPWGYKESDTTEWLTLTILFCPICLSCHISLFFFPSITTKQTCLTIWLLTLCQVLSLQISWLSNTDGKTPIIYTPPTLTSLFTSPSSNLSTAYWFANSTLNVLTRFLLLKSTSCLNYWFLYWYHQSLNPQA